MSRLVWIGEAVTVNNHQARIEVGLIRRLQLFVDLALKKNKLYKQSKYDKTFSHRYLWSKHHRDEENSFDLNVQIVVNALSIANAYDRNRALLYVKHMAQFSSFDVELVRFALDPDMEPALLKSQVPNSPDYSLFNVDALNEKLSTKIRNCYERELGRVGIRLPFGKTDMAKINDVLNSRRRSQVVKEYSDLETLITTFLRSAWPLFSPKALSISFNYLRQSSPLSAQKHDDYYKILSRFGLEKLQLRLIILRAVNGDTAAIEFLENKSDWSSAQLAHKLESSVRSFLVGNRQFHAIDTESNSENPIAVLIQLSMFVNCHTGSFNFLTRLLSVYEIDPSIVRFLNWDQLRPEITAAKQFATPALIFLAAILRQREVYINYEYLENKYGPGGAGADLRKVATYHRAELKHSRTKFILAILRLPKRAATATFQFLLAPGMIDRIANIFPTEGSLVPADHKDSLSLALEFRIACLNAMRGKNLISRIDWTLLFNESRTALRKLRYDEKAQAGRLRVTIETLATEIAAWRHTNHELLNANQVDQSPDFLTSSNKFRAELLADDLADYIVYRNRLAFDLQLANNLRHFFLSHKILTSIRDGMPAQFDENANAKKWLEVIDGYIDDYCNNWITLSRNRSYIAKLKTSLQDFMLEILVAKINESQFDAQVSAFCIEGFEKHLSDCRLAWRAGVRRKIQDEVARYMEEFSVDQMTVDKVKLNVDSAFAITESWIAIDQTEYPNSFMLKEQIFFEAIHLKSGKEFRRNLTIEVARDSRKIILGTVWDVELNSEWIDTIVALVDNLIENACKYSGMRDATPIEFLLVRSPKQIQILVSNPFRPEETEKLGPKIATIRTALACKISEETLRGRGGTGLIRIRYAASKVSSEKFSLTFNEAAFDRGRIEFIATFKNVQSELVNVTSQNISN